MRSVLALALASTAVAVPTQINIHYTPTVGTLSLDFVSTSADGVAQYGTSSNPATFTNATTSSFNFAEIGYLHQTTMTFAATPGASAFYRACSANSCSQVFHIIPNQVDETFAVFGDFGLINDVAMDYLTAEAAKGTYDSVLHVGDWAYDFDSLASLIGNGFMTLAQGYMAIKPTAVVEGNHEACTACIASDPRFESGNFTQYKMRFHSVSLNSNTGNNRYYSFNRGITHFIVFSAEAYLYARSEAFLSNQLAFMSADLAAVDRKATPWVVALCHKDWTMETEAFNAFTPVLLQNKVDVLFVGHVHYYNRYMPYDSVTGDQDAAAVSADTFTYTNPKYMVVIVTGASGDHEDDDKCAQPDSRPSLTCTENYGIGYFHPINATVAEWSFVTVKADGPGPQDYSDHLTIIQNGH